MAKMHYVEIDLDNCRMPWGLNSSLRATHKWVDSYDDCPYQYCERCGWRAQTAQADMRCDYGASVGRSHMYGWPFDQEPEAPKPPEKSPADKALDEFIKRREAKREGADGVNYPTPPKPGEAEAREKRYQEQRKAFDQSESLGNAMSKLTHWEQTVHERIMPYRQREGV